MTIQETAGLGGNINSITVTNFNPPIVYTSDVIAQRSGTNRVAAKGSLLVPVTVIYGLVDNPAASRAIPTTSRRYCFTPSFQSQLW